MTQAPQRWGKLEPDQMLKHRPDTTLAASKTVVRLRVPWVRIPPPPPDISHCYRSVFQDTAGIRTCPDTTGAYARCAFPSWPAETGQVPQTGGSYRKSLLRRFWWYGQARVGETPSAGMWVGFTRDNKAAPRLVIEGRRSDSNRYPWFRRSRAGRAVLPMRLAGACRPQASSRSARVDDGPGGWSSRPPARGS